MSDLFLAVETGGTKLQFVLGDAQGCIVQRSRLSVARERGFQGILEAVTAQVPLFSAAAAQNGARIAHIGVGFGGPVDARSGCVLGSMQISGWSDFPLKTYLEEKTGLPVRVYNDTDAATWGEYRLGAGRGTRNFVLHEHRKRRRRWRGAERAAVSRAGAPAAWNSARAYAVGAADTAERVEALCLRLGGGALSAAGKNPACKRSLRQAAGNPDLSGLGRRRSAAKMPTPVRLS